ncbi:hypothetical protein [Desertivirga brevis]|uniref:hypothetical protein n=1 Tax=Desertivirga brevis TaxID=2810310 RepID=UPI001A96B125|nr:hypothetical protein [Pedobacter sp. SYSU D00873]
MGLAGRLLVYQNHKCGEWGGDIETIKIYRTTLKGDIYADYLLETLDCKDIDSRIRKIENRKKKIKLSESDKARVIESLSQLAKGILSREVYPAHSGYFSKAILSDSSIVIEDFPSIKWTQFEQLRAAILKK